MKTVYVVNVEVRFAKERNDGVSGFGMSEGVYESENDAMEYVKKEFAENTGNDGNVFSFTLEAPMVRHTKKGKEKLADIGDHIDIFIDEIDFFENKIES